MPSTSARFALAFLTFLLPASSFGQGLGVTWTGELVLFDPATGLSAVISDTGYDKCQSMAKTVDGRIFMFANESPFQLLEIHPTTFEITGSISTGLNDIRALAADPNDPQRIYAVNVPASSQFDDLYVLDLSVPGSTLIGRLPYQKVQGLTFVPNGPLYAWDVSAGLVQVDPQTAGASDVNALNDGTSDIQSLAWYGGTLYGIREQIYRFDLLTGDFTVDVPGNFGDIRGAEIVDGLCGSHSYCQTSPNSVGAGSLISHAGSMSITANDFVLLSSGNPVDKFGIFFMGPTETAVSFGNGILCVSGSLTRYPVVVTNASGVATYALDNSAAPALGKVVPGSTWKWQFWYRDPMGGGAFFNLSDAMSSSYCP